MAQTHRFSGRYWLRLAVFAVVLSSTAALFLLVHFVRLQLNAFVTPHRNRNVGTPAELNRPYEDIILTTADGLEITGWHIFGTQPKAVILIHGINANRSDVLPEAEVLAQAGYHLLLIDLRAHGLSQGNQATYGYKEALDVQAAIEYLDRMPDIEHIGVFGKSYGGAAAVRTAAIDSRIKAVVVASSYSSLIDAANDAFDDMSIFPKWPFAPLFITLAERRVGLKISQVNSARDLASLQSEQAVLIIHGTNDTLFPLYHAEKMYAAAHEPKGLWVIEGFTHSNAAVEHKEEFETRVVSFFEDAFNSNSK